ncbi:sigma-70 family RNA polymerase sigma factor [Novosphingobium terrae]|uniref:sigma-70 family RNA polymerase sigma factor n=1 Tax=Novosphingobium terrae TaxID=2726189 RepID=UPI00197E821C|nr:sigma-70 family RNA polymerase sigma factor [Novosphingobium terrae]
MNHHRLALDLYRAHRLALTRYADTIIADRAQAEDVVQEAWLRLHHVKDPDLIRDPIDYFYRVVRNLALDSLRAMKRETARFASSVDAIAGAVADQQPSAEQASTARSELDRVMEALAELPERTQIAVRMNRMEGRKLREIAAHLGLSVGRVHTLIAEGVAYCDARRHVGTEARGEH